MALSNHLGMVESIIYRSVKPCHELSGSLRTVWELVDEQLRIPLRPLPARLKTQMKLFQANTKDFTSVIKEVINILTSRAARELCPKGVTTILATHSYVYKRHNNNLSQIYRVVHGWTIAQAKGGFYRERVLHRQDVINEHIRQLIPIKEDMSHIHESHYLPLLSRRLDHLSQPQLEHE
jgi:hypothetical protein